MNVPAFKPHNVFHHCLLRRVVPMLFCLRLCYLKFALRTILSVRRDNSSTVRLPDKAFRINNGRTAAYLSTELYKKVRAQFSFFCVCFVFTLDPEIENAYPLHALAKSVAIVSTTVYVRPIGQRAKSNPVIRGTKNTSHVEFMH